MARLPRQNHSPASKAKGAVAASEGEETPIQPAQGFDVHPTRIGQWFDRLLERATGAFSDGLRAEPQPVIDVTTLPSRIGELTLKNEAPQGLRGPIGAMILAVMSGALGGER